MQACTYLNRNLTLSSLQQAIQRLSSTLQALLVPATDNDTSSTSTSHRRLQQAAGGDASTNGTSTPVPGMATSVNVTLPAPEQLAALVAAAGGAGSFFANGYYDDWDYDLLLAAVAGLQAQYAGAQCAAGYEGTLCGSCAYGFGSTGPAKCSRCPAAWLNGCYYVGALLITLTMLVFTLRELLKQVCGVLRAAWKLAQAVLHCTGMRGW